MSYNLNFYPNDFYQSGFGNGYNPYTTLLGLDNNAGLKYIQNNAENRLNQLQNNIQNQFTPQNFMQQNNNQVQQPYYLFCGKKEDWDEFLMLNYGITEQTIFNDYKLFLQAKQELLEEQGQNKIDTMKDRIKNKDKDRRFTNIDATVQSNVKPMVQQPIQQPVQQQYIQQPTNQPVEQPVIINGNSNGFNMGDSSESDNGLRKQSGFKPKDTNRKR